MIPFGVLPLRFWLATAVSVSVVVLALMALGAIDSVEDEQAAAAVHFQQR
ncbi:MAG: hypothetical protein AB7O64_19115 [Methylibium sp.]